MLRFRYNEGCIISLDPGEAAQEKFEQILNQDKSEDERASEIIWAAVGINAGLGFIPLGVNIWTFISVSTIMVAWIGSVYGLTLTNEKAGQLITQIFRAVGSTFLITTLGLKLFAEILKGLGIFTLGAASIAGMAFDAVLSGATTYAIGTTSRELFKRDLKMSNADIKSVFTHSFNEGKQKVGEKRAEEEHGPH